MRVKIPFAKLETVSLENRTPRDSSCYRRLSIYVGIPLLHSTTAVSQRKQAFRFLKGPNDGNASPEHVPFNYPLFH